jgi:hypothetical protein
MTNRTVRNSVLALVTAVISAAAIVRAEKPAANTPPNPAVASPSAKFEKEIAGYEATDKTSPPPQGAVLFIGDSGIMKWTTLAEDFPDQAVINRGFGGSQMADAVFYADRIVIPYKPRLIILREGGNDLTAGKTANQLLTDLKAFVAKVHAELPTRASQSSASTPTRPAGTKLRNAEQRTSC